MENRILEIEEQLQTLGVQLGDYDAENEYCTVRFSMAEGAEVRITLAQRLKVAFIWSAKYYALLMLGFALALLCAAILAKIVEGMRSKA